MEPRIGAILSRHGGTCPECQGKIMEVRSAIEGIIGPGQHEGWRCTNCKKDYPYSLAPIDDSSVARFEKLTGRKLRKEY